MDESATSTVFRDVIFNMLGAFAIICILMLPWLNDPKRADAVETPGALMISAVWNADSLADVDLWALAPGNDPVGYSRQNTLALNLLRDDLGAARDLTRANIEYIFGRSTPPGEYIVNVHLYSDIKHEAPLTVEITGTLIRPSSPPQVVFQRQITLMHTNEERTVARFIIGENGELIGGISDLPRMIRNRTEER